MHEWIDIAGREYLTDYIQSGGGSVKFLCGAPDALAEIIAGRGTSGSCST